MAVDDGWGREWAEKEVSKGQALAKRYKELSDKYITLAGKAAVERDYAKAKKIDHAAREARDSMHYWLGHMNAFQGVAAQLGFQEVVEEERITRIAEDDARMIQEELEDWSCP